MLTSIVSYLNAYLLTLNAYLIAEPSTCNGDSIPNCRAQVLCEAYIQQLHGEPQRHGVEVCIVEVCWHNINL